MRVRDRAELASDFFRLAHVEHEEPAPMLVEPLGADLRDAGERAPDRTPARLVRRAAGLGSTGAEVRRHGDVDLLRMRQAEVRHVADEVADAAIASETRVELLL